MRAVRSAVQHCLNPLHVYCRLREIGLSKRLAHKACALYERLFHLFALS